MNYKLQLQFSESHAQIIDDAFIFIEYMQWKYIFSNNTMVYVPYAQPVKQITLNFVIQNKQTRFLSTTFLCSKFKLSTLE